MRSLPTCLIALTLAACALDPARPTVSHADRAGTDVLGRPAYAARARERERDLHDRLLELFASTQARAQVVRDELDARLAQFRVPPRLATRDRYLSSLARADVDAYEAKVAELFAAALLRLDTIRDDTLAKAVQIAAAMAPERSPLDAGATGDVSLDRQVASFEETLRLALDREALVGRGYREAVRRIELLPVFSGFNAEGADERLGGRLTVFVGGDPDSTPRVDVVLRCVEGVAPAERGIVQAVRFRIMAGDTIVRDLGWQPLPAPDGLPAVGIDGAYLVAPNVGPALEATVGSGESLADRRILADVQTAVFDRDRQLLGGADWRLEYRVSGRGSITWQVAAVEPRFEQECAETAALLAGDG